MITNCSPPLKISSFMTLSIAPGCKERLVATQHPGFVVKQYTILDLHMKISRGLCRFWCFLDVITIHTTHTYKAQYHMSLALSLGCYGLVCTNTMLKSPSRRLSDPRYFALAEFTCGVWRYTKRSCDRFEDVATDVSRCRRAPHATQDKQIALKRLFSEMSSKRFGHGRF